MEGESSVKTLKFGYNFVTGEVNRDRERLTDPREQAETLAQIWAEAIKIDESNTLVEYAGMLQSAEQYSDVDLASDFITKDLAKKIWREIQSCKRKGGLFYYNVDGNNVANVSA